MFFWPEVSDPPVLAADGSCRLTGLPEHVTLEVLLSHDEFEVRREALMLLHDLDGDRDLDLFIAMTGRAPPACGLQRKYSLCMSFSGAAVVKMCSM